MINRIKVIAIVILFLFNLLFLYNLIETNRLYNEILIENKLYKIQNESFHKDIKQLKEEIKNNDERIFIVEYRELKNSIIPSDWDNYFPRVNENAQEDITNKSLKQVIEIMGTPYITIKEITVSDKEVTRFLIYNPNFYGEDMDNTGIAIIFKNDIVVDYNVGDFNSFDTKSLKYLGEL